MTIGDYGVSDTNANVLAGQTVHCADMDVIKQVLRDVGQVIKCLMTILWV